MQEEFKDTKKCTNGVIRTHNYQRTDNRKKEKRTNNDLQNTTNKSKDRVTRTTLKTQPDSVLLLF